MSQKPTTALCRYSETEVYYRDRNLVDDILAPGKDADFLSVAVWHMLGRELSDAERKVLNAILITMMEHGFTPSAIATRSVYMSAPENLQGAVAAGLLAVGSSFVGTVENNARVLDQIVSAKSEDREAVAGAIVDDHLARKAPMPGFGHHLHKPVDPRAMRLLEMAAETGLEGEHCAALRLLSKTLDTKRGKATTINATGATAALLGEMNVPVDLMRGFSVLGRTAGLLAHVAEERRRPSGRYIWDLVDRDIEYAPDYAEDATTADNR